MLKTVTFTADIPSASEFGGKYCAYKNFALAGGKELFELLMTPETLIAAKVATEMGFPAVAGIADRAFKVNKSKLSDYEKQYIGALVCMLMEKNGYSKTGRKREIPHKAFTKGEFYGKQ